MAFIVELSRGGYVEFFPTLILAVLVVVPTYLPGDSAPPLPDTVSSVGSERE